MDVYATLSQMIDQSTNGDRQPVNGGSNQSTVAADNGRRFAAILRSKYLNAALGYMTRGYNVGDRRPVIETLRALVSKSTRMSDIEVCRKILTVLNKYPTAESGRIDERVKNIVAMIEPYRDSSGSNTQPTKAILDYGCGDGSISAALGAALGAERIYGVDILPECPAPIIYLQYNIKTIPDESLDLVTALVALHHIPNVGEVLTEISRVLRKGGLFLIREHDFDHSPSMFAFLDLIHVFVEVKNTGTSPKDLLDTREYWPRDTLTKKISETGFILKKSDKYPEPNPQGLYHSVYERA